MTYTEIKSEYVIETVAKANVVVCDFKGKRILECDGLTVNAIKSFTESADAKFFKVIADE